MERIPPGSLADTRAAARQQLLAQNAPARKVVSLQPRSPRLPAVINPFSAQAQRLGQLRPGDVALGLASTTPRPSLVLTSPRAPKAAATRLELNSMPAFETEAQRTARLQKDRLRAELARERTDASNSSLGSGGVQKMQARLAAEAARFAERSSSGVSIEALASAETRPPLTDPEATGPAARAGTRPPHFGPEALLKSVESGAIAPLRGRWVVDLDANDGRLKRRQDLPPEAFFPADELRRLTEALGDDYGLLFAGLS